MNAADRLFVALDFPSAAEALALAEALAPLGVGLKMGLELFSAEGPGLAAELAKTAPLFLDLKFHDIPNTVDGAVGRVANLGAAVTNIHLSGGETMARAAVAARDAAASKMMLIGVTILTSLDDADLADLCGGNPDASKTALRLAERARDWGLDGVVASAREAAAIRKACGEDFLIVTPGIRPAGGAVGDQKRVLTPREALDAGASHLVVGRPIARAADPAAACRAILAEMEGLA